MLPVRVMCPGRLKPDSRKRGNKALWMFCVLTLLGPVLTGRAGELLSYSCQTTQPASEKLWHFNPRDIVCDTLKLSYDIGQKASNVAALLHFTQRKASEIRNSVPRTRWVPGVGQFFPDQPV